MRTTLQLINHTLDEVLAEQDGECDVQTRWAVAWFEMYAMKEGPYGQAETLSKAKNMALQTLVEAGRRRARYACLDLKNMLRMSSGILLPILV